jgi:polysaccharide export outer membrane protein
VKGKLFFAVVSLIALGCGSLLAQQKDNAAVSATPALETVQQTNQKIRLLANTASAAEPSEFPLGAGDLIKIDVFDIPELSREIRVDPGGYISMPLIPQRILAAGLTSYQLESKIADLLKARGLVSHPEVSVFVIQRNSQPITVIGAVEHPLVYQAVQPTTLLEVLSAAGGLTNTAGDFVTISRPERNGQQSVERVNLEELIDRGDPKANVSVRGGDVITVPKAGIVYVVGAVNRPGGFVIQNDTDQMTALKALALAGGAKAAAKPQNAVIIRKNPKTGQSQEIAVNVKNILSRKAQDVRLLPNDILFIPDSAGKKMLAKAAEAALSMTTGIVILRGSQF